MKLLEKQGRWHEWNCNSPTYKITERVAHPGLTKLNGKANHQMEGLIPFIYKAIKERRRRSYSRCSSTGSEHRRFGASVDDDLWEQKQWVAPARTDLAGGGDGGKFSAEREMTHRRHRSLEELAGEVGGSPEWRLGALPRGRSVRIFSCISGM